MMVARSMTHQYALSVTDASAKGVAALVRDAEGGAEVVVERRRLPVAAVVSVRRLEALREAERDLRDIGLILARLATDTGERTALDDAISRFGFDRAALEAELDDDLVAGRE